jgi:hypothetical protein
MRRRQISLVQAVGWCVVVAACGGNRGPSFAVSDSAGVEVVTTLVPIWDSAGQWTIDPDPILRLGLTEGDEPYLFQDIQGVVLLEDGRIVVADGLSRELRFFDSSGSYLLKAGGPGQGPGEFTILYGLGRCGEGLFAFDPGQRRVNVFGLQGKFRGTIPVLEPKGNRGAYRSRCGPDGKLVIAGWGQQRQRNPDGPELLFQQGAPVWLVDPQNGTVVELGEYITSERVVTMHGGSGPHPFGRSVVFTLDRDHVFLGTSERLQVEVRDHGGRLLRIYRGPDTDLTITPEVLSDYREAELNPADSLIRDRLVEHDMPMPPGMPAYLEFILDPDGNLWTERFPMPGEANPRWGVVSAEGKFYGHMEMPDGFQLMGVTRDQLLGVSRDSLGVERVELYRLSRN